MMPLSTMEQMAFIAETPSQLATNGDNFLVYSPQISALVKQIEAEGKFPYSVDVAQRAAPTFFGQAGPGLDILIYNSSRYQQALKTCQAYSQY